MHCQPMNQQPIKIKDDSANQIKVCCESNSDNEGLEIPNYMRGLSSKIDKIYPKSIYQIWLKTRVHIDFQPWKVDGKTVAWIHNTT